MTEDHICRLVEEHAPMLLRLACTRLDSPADAEDAEHEKAWLIRTTLHRAADFRRSAARRNVPLEEAAQAAAAEDSGELLAAVRGLPEKYSAVIHLHYYEGYSIKEIAALLGLPASTVGTRLARGRERLRQMLKEDALNEP